MSFFPGHILVQNVKIDTDSILKYGIALTVKLGSNDYYLLLNVSTGLQVQNALEQN